MHKLLHKGINISARRHHHLKAVYTYTVGDISQEESKDNTIEAMCTIREGPDLLDEATCGGRASVPQPISFCIKGSQATVRPWDPNSCIIASAIANDLIHLPIKPGRWIYVVDCSLLTLSHIADIAGNKGRLIGVWDESYPDLPSKEVQSKFLRSYPNSVLLTTDVKNASLDYYERMLSLPAASKHELFMALHPRVGSGSPVRKLLQAEDPSVIFRHIFGFLECGDMARIKCMVFCHWPPDTRPDVVRDIMLTHMDIMRRWRRPPGEPAVLANAEPEGNGEEGPEASPDEEQVAKSSDAQAEKHASSKGQKSEKEAVPEWVLMGVPLDNIATDSQQQDACTTLVNVIEVTRRLGNGHRTGLQAKEQLRLVPHFPKHFLLCLKYTAPRDGKSSKLSKKKALQPPKHDSVPMPFFGKAPPGLSKEPGEAPPAEEPGLLSPAPADVAAASARVSIMAFGHEVGAQSAQGTQPRPSQRRTGRAPFGFTAPGPEPPAQEWQQPPWQQLAVVPTMSKTQLHAEQLKRQPGHNQSALAAAVAAGACPEAWAGSTGSNWQSAAWQEQLALAAARAAAGGMHSEASRGAVDLEALGGPWHAGVTNLRREGWRGAAPVPEPPGSEPLARLWQQAAGFPPAPELRAAAARGGGGGAPGMREAQQLRALQQAAAPTQASPMLGWPGGMEPPPGLGLPSAPAPTQAWPPAPAMGARAGGWPQEGPRGSGRRLWGATSHVDLPTQGLPWGHR